jgi:hypothetical protein
MLAQAHDFYKSAAEQDQRDEESRNAHTLPEIFLQMILHHETCQKCGMDLDRVFIWNNQRLCKKCMVEGQGNWEIVSSGSGAANAIRIKAPGPKPAIDSFISWILASIGLKKAPSIEPLFVWNRVQEPRARVRISKDAKDKKNLPSSEGIMKRKKKKPGKRFGLETRIWEDD